MDQEFLDWLFTELIRRGVTVEHGLTDNEIAAVQDTYGFVFPPDLRCVLQYMLPVYQPLRYEPPEGTLGVPLWVDWRHASEEAIRFHLSWPLQTVCVDVERNGFWVDDWGIRPSDPIEARLIAQQHITSAPILIPISSHAFLPSTPLLPGNPVFSVWFTDVIRQGHSLKSYFKKVLLGGRSDTFREQPVGTPRYIPLWDDLLTIRVIFPTYPELYASER